MAAGGELLRERVYGRALHRVAVTDDPASVDVEVARRDAREVIAHAEAERPCLRQIGAFIEERADGRRHRVGHDEQITR